MPAGRKANNFDQRICHFHTIRLRIKQPKPKKTKQKLYRSLIVLIYFIFLLFLVDVKFIVCVRLDDCGIFHRKISRHMLSIAFVRDERLQTGRTDHCTVVVYQLRQCDAVWLVQYNTLHWISTRWVRMQLFCSFYYYWNVAALCDKAGADHCSGL